MWSSTIRPAKISTIDICTLSLMTAVCVISRVYLTFLPNIKPVTPIIILIATYYGAARGIMVACLQALVSGLLLGLGTFLPFQMLAWSFIAFIAAALAPFIKRSICFSAAFAGLSGLLFGIIVSFEKLLFLPVEGAFTYWLMGTPFDFLHAVGNIAFMLVGYTSLKRLFSLSDLST